MHPILNVADQAARKAGRQIIKALETRTQLKVYEKQSQERFTDVDLKTESLIIEHIHAAYPTHSILSEESGLLRREEEYLWLVDPLDGSTNFIHGLQGFSISIAVQRHGVLSQALVYDPLAQESFYASRGQGARSQRTRLRVSEHNQLKHALLYLNRPPIASNELDAWSNMIKSVTKKSAGVRLLGSAALGLAYVAAGRLDGFLSFSSLRPWDMAAGVLLVQEAGGTLCDIKGETDYLKTGQLIATNTPLNKSLIQLVRALT